MEPTQLGRYQLVRKIATGGMAEVFLARAVGPGGFEKTLVIKRILPTLAEDPEFVAMFLHEARLAAQLNHANIVQIFDFGEVDGTFYLAMEYVDGPNLRSILRRVPDRRVPPAYAARLIIQACEGLAYAHEYADPATGEPLGLVHRDISADNLLVAKNGVVKVVDFGVAKVAGQVSNTAAGTVKGKIAYMPPEQILGETDLRSDVYALGVILYEMVAGTRPYEQLPEVQLLAAIMQRDPPPLLQRVPDAPVAFAMVVEKAMARDVRARFQDCRELEAALEDYLASSGERVSNSTLGQFVTSVVGTPSTAVSASNLKPVTGSAASSPGSGRTRSQATPVSGSLPARKPSSGSLPVVAPAIRAPASGAYPSVGPGVPPAGGKPQTASSLQPVVLSALPVGASASQPSPFLPPVSSPSGLHAPIGVPPSSPRPTSMSGGFAPVPPAAHGDEPLARPRPQGAPDWFSRFAAGAEAEPPGAQLVEATKVLPSGATAELKASALLAVSHSMRGYHPGEPLAPQATLDELREALERDESVGALMRFALHAARLVPAHAQAPALIAERLVGCVEGLLQAEAWAELAKVLERLEAAAPNEPTTRWVWDVVRASYATPEQTHRLVERLAEAAPGDTAAFAAACASSGPSSSPSSSTCRSSSTARRAERRC
jgi:serine/threonine-protein kinase